MRADTPSSFYVLEESREEEAASPVITAEEYFQALHEGVDLFEKEETEWSPSFDADITHDSAQYDLPRVRCNACRRDAWTLYQALPFDLPAGSPLWQSIGRSNAPVYLSPADWDVFAQELSEEMRRAGRRVPLFGPSYRFGALRLRIQYRRPKEFFELRGLGGTFISERVAQVLEEGEVSGYDLYPAPVEESKPRPPSATVPPLPLYYELAVVGQARLDRERAEYSVVSSSPCEVCSRWFRPYCDEVRWRALHVDLSTWDGSDLLRLEEASHLILVTERVKEVLANANVTGFRLIPADTISKPVIFDIRHLSQVDIDKAFSDQ